MTSYIQLKRICEFCSKEFNSKTTVTRFCSSTCRSRAGKMKIRSANIKVSNEETLQVKILQLEELKKKEFLTVRDVASLLSCSVRTVYYYIDNNTIEAVNIGKRMTRIKRSSIDKLLIKPEPEKTSEAEVKAIEYTLADCIGTYEVRRKYQISESTLRSLIIRNNIPRLRKGSLAFVPKVLIEGLLERI
jgi:excisionase family DNA binding protein